MEPQAPVSLCHGRNGTYPRCIVVMGVERLQMREYLPTQELARAVGAGTEFENTSDTHALTEPDEQR